MHGRAARVRRGGARLRRRVGRRAALALHAGFPPERIVLHGNAKSDGRAARGARRPASRDRRRQLRRARPARARSRRRRSQRAAARHAGRRRRHPRAILTGHAGSKFGFSLAAGARGDRAARASAWATSPGLHMHVGSQLLDLDPFRAGGRGARRRSATSASTTSAAGSASPTPSDRRPPRSRSGSARARPPRDELLGPAGARRSSPAARWSPTRA